MKKIGIGMQVVYGLRYSPTFLCVSIELLLSGTESFSNENSIHSLILRLRFNYRK